MSRKALAIVGRTPTNVCRIPAAVAFADLLERITDRGVEIDAGSKLTALEDPALSQLHAHAKKLELISGLNGAARRRKGAPIPPRDR